MRFEGVLGEGGKGTEGGRSLGVFDVLHGFAFVRGVVVLFGVYLEDLYS